MAIVSKEIAIDAEIEFDVSCNECGSILEATVNRYNELCVDPCEKCLQVKYDEGFEAAKQKFQELAKLSPVTA